MWKSELGVYLVDIVWIYLSIQEDSEKTGKVTSAGMYFLHFQVYRMDSTVNAVWKLCALGFFSFAADCLEKVVTVSAMCS